MDQGIEFKNMLKIYWSRPYAIQFLQLCLSKFYVGVWSYTWVANGRNLFGKFIGKNKSKIEKTMAFFFTTYDCTKENDGQLYKKKNRLWENAK